MSSGLCRLSVVQDLKPTNQICWLLEKLTFWLIQKRFTINVCFARYHSLFPMNIRKNCTYTSNRYSIHSQDGSSIRQESIPRMSHTFHPSSPPTPYTSSDILYSSLHTSPQSSTHPSRLDADEHYPAHLQSSRT
jgi:hypothetical protein